jgi:S1-C subfamily serine protease
VAAVLCLGAPLGACGKDDPSRPAATAPQTGRPDTVERTTRVEVVKASGADEGFDPETIYRRDSPGVVTILSTGLRENGKEGAGQGSGFVVNAGGEIATNAHVITSGEGNAVRKAEKVFVRFPDGNQVPASIVGYDPFADVGLIKVSPAGLRLRPLPLGSVERVKVGAPVAAIGSPFGEEQSLSVGIVSATDRSIQSLTGFQTSGAIQTDAAINQGNSGGPLLDAGGSVLGINSQIRTQSGDGTGVGFAVPVDTVKRSLDQLRKEGKVHYAYLGVSSQQIYPQLAERFKLPVKQGVWVQEVVPDGPADKAGISAGHDTQRFQEQPFQVGGDIITAVNGHEVQLANDLSRALEPQDVGSKVTLTIFRKGEERKIVVTLGERPLSRPDRG